MELFFMFICYVLGVVVGYELVKFLRAAWFLHKLGKAKKMLDEILGELNGMSTSQEADKLIDRPFDKAFNDLGKSIHNLGTSVQKPLNSKEEE